MKSLRVINKRDSEILKKPEDDFLSKVVKYIPTEIVGAYTAFRAIILPDKAQVGENLSLLPYGTAEDHLALAIAFYVGLILTPIYKYRTLKVPDLDPAYYQIAISTLAFAVWVFAFGDYFEINFPSWYSHKIAAIALIVFSLIVPLIEDFFIKSPPTNP